MITRTPQPDLCAFFEEVADKLTPPPRLTNAQLLALIEKIRRA